MTRQNLIRAFTKELVVVILDSQGGPSARGAALWGLDPVDQCTLIGWFLVLFLIITTNVHWLGDFLFCSWLSPPMYIDWVISCFVPDYHHQCTLIGWFLVLFLIITTNVHWLGDFLFCSWLSPPSYIDWVISCFVPDYHHQVTLIGWFPVLFLIITTKLHWLGDFLFCSWLSPPMYIDWVISCFVPDYHHQCTPHQELIRFARTFFILRALNTRRWQNKNAITETIIHCMLLTRWQAIRRTLICAASLRKSAIFYLHNPFCWLHESLSVVSFHFNCTLNTLPIITLAVDPPPPLTHPHPPHTDTQTTSVEPIWFDLKKHTVILYGNIHCRRMHML